MWHSAKRILTPFLVMFAHSLEAGVVCLESRTDTMTLLPMRLLSVYLTQPNIIARDEIAQGTRFYF